jgi:hypothetical protein
MGGAYSKIPNNYSSKELMQYKCIFNMTKYEIEKSDKKEEFFYFLIYNAKNQEEEFFLNYMNLVINNIDTSKTINNKNILFYALECKNQSLISIILKNNDLKHIPDKIFYKTDDRDILCCLRLIVRHKNWIPMNHIDLIFDDRFDNRLINFIDLSHIAYYYHPKQKRYLFDKYYSDSAYSYITVKLLRNQQHFDKLCYYNDIDTIRLIKEKYKFNIIRSKEMEELSLLEN